MQPMLRRPPVSALVTQPGGVARPALLVGALASLLPFVSAGMALVGGALVALTVGNPWQKTTRKLTHLLLAAAVVGLGAGMDLRAVVAVGAHGVGYTVVGIAVCLGLGRVLGRWLGVSRHVAALITVGTAICGGSAIAAVVPVLRPKEHDVSAALATVFVLNAVALLLFPAIGHRVGLSPEAFGLWSALAIHDTSSVVGAALAYGGNAVAVATTVKLARALWLVPLTVGRALLQRRGAGGGRARRPWFILGFLAVAALVTFVPSLQPAGRVVVAGAHRALVVTLFLIGANLTRDALRAVGVRPLVLGLTLWLTMAGLTLSAVAARVIR
jgi:uncharacterized integral membrane protein (TIGR00698 family)